MDTIISKILSMVLNIGENSASTCCIFWLHQPKVPKYFFDKKNKI